MTTGLPIYDLSDFDPAKLTLKVNDGRKPDVLLYDDHLFTVFVGNKAHKARIFAIKKFDEKGKQKK
jgi:hypothetical protein